MRRIVSLLAAVSLTAAALIVMMTASATPASANDPANNFTAAALPTWQANGIVWAVASTNGLVFAGGSFTQLYPPGTSAGNSASVNRANLAVLDAATGNPTSCLLDVARTAGSPLVRALTLSPDKSTLYVGGLFTSIGGVGRTDLAAINVATCSVLPFNPAPNSFVYAINVTASTVYYGGNFSAVNGVNRTDLAAAAVGSGALLPWAPAVDDEIFALGVDPNNGNVILGGRLNTLNGQNSHALGIVDGVTGTTNVKNYPAGFFPWTPGTGQRQGTSVVKAITTDSTGFYTGSEGTGFGIFDGRTAFDWGTYNQRWRDTCLGANQAVLVYKSVLFWGSHSHDCSSVGWWENGTRHYFGSETTANMQIEPWYATANDGIGEGLGPRALTVGSSGGSDYLWYGGEFTAVNGAPQQGLTHFGQGVDAAGPANLYDPIVLNTVPGQLNVVWRATTDIDDSALTYTVYRNGSTTPIDTVSANSSFWSKPQVNFVDTSVVAGQTYSYRIKASDGTTTTPYSTSASGTVLTAAATPYPARIMSDGASVYYRSDDPTGTFGGSAPSQGSSDLGGVYVNTVTHAVGGPLTGNSGSYVTFDGASSYQHTWVRQQAPTTYTMETWFRTTTTRGGRLIGFGNNAFTNGVNNLSDKFDRQIYMTNTGQLMFGSFTGSYVTLTSAAGLNNGQWHQVVATQGASGMALYVDGVRVGTNTSTGGQSYTGFWRIGGDSLSGWPGTHTSNFFAGDMDEIAVYPASLSGSQIANHYALSGRTPGTTPAPTDPYGGAITADQPNLYWRLGEAAALTTAADSSLNSNTGAYGSTVTKGVAGAVAGTADTAISLTGVSTGLVSANTAQLSPTTFSTELWFKTNTTKGGKLIGFGTSKTGSSANYDKHIYMTNSGQLIFGVWPGSAKVITTAAAYNNNVWHQVVGTQDGTGTKLYVDGTLVGSNAAALGNQAITGYWRVGGDAISTVWPSPPTNSYFTGAIDEVAVYNYALPSASVNAHYLIGTGQTAPDTQAPTVPGAVAASTSEPSVNVSWQPSTDNVAVTGYRVYRSSTNGFSAGSATKIADVPSGTTYTDASAPPGTWYYQVAAFDAAGNVSAGSAQVSAVVADTIAPTAPNALTATAVGSTVALSWTAATDNVAVTDYRVYRSSTSGFLTGAGTKIADVTSGTTYTDIPPASGTWYYRVTALDAVNNESAPTSQAAVTVGDTQSPSAPTTLTATPTGTSVGLSWSAATDNVAVTHYQVFRSTTAGFAPSAATQIADVTTTATTDAAPVAGTFYYVVEALDGAGNVSSPSPQASAIVAPADTTPPSAPTNLTATVGTGVALSWTASTDDTGVTGYSVYRSTTAGFTAGSANLIGTVSSGTTGYTDAAPAGTWFYQVTAVDAAGNVSGASNEVTAVVPSVDTTAPSAPTALTASASGSTVTLNWTASTDDVGVVSYQLYRSATSAFSANSASLVGVAVTAGTTTTDTPGPGTWFYLVTASDAAGNVSAASGQASATITAVDTTAPSAPAGLTASASGATVSLSWSASTDAVGVVSYQLYRSATSGFSANSASAVGGAVSAGTSTTDSPGAGTWFYLVTASDAAGNVSAASGQASATITAVDTTAPSVPVGVAATAAGSTVSVSWSASTDNVGVVDYLVFRSASSGAGAVAGNQVADVVSPNLSFVDAGRPVGTWFYVVVARDAAGNASAASAEVSATVVAGPVQTVTLSPTEDTWANQLAQTTNFGTSSSLAARGGANPYLSYLKFTLPAAPVGKSLVGAKLNIRTTTDATAGSVDTYSVSLTPTTWTETTLTYANRPALGVVAGSLTGAAAVNTAYSALLTPSVLAAQPAGPVSLAITSSSATGDNLLFWSSNYAGTTSRPQLVLTYQ